MEFLRKCMQNLPDPDVYEQEYTFLPWGKLIDEVVVHVSQNARRDGAVLDLMCGPGYLLGQIQDRRPDLRFFGVDLDEKYLAYARTAQPHVTFKKADVLGRLDGITRQLGGRRTFDVVTCTAGIHHLPDESQVTMLKRIRGLVGRGGFAVIGDPHIGDYSDERERLLAGAELGYHTLTYAIKRGASKRVIDAAVDVLRNDVLQVEWKTSPGEQLARLESVFGHVSPRKTWPDFDSRYGDYYYVCRK